MGQLPRFVWLTLLIPVNIVLGGSVKCNSQQFQCSSGDQCIPLNWRCDTDNDCHDKSDEKDCAYKPCSAKEFRCNNKKCISKTDVCDGFKDCPEGEDESSTICDRNCNSTTHFVCTRGLPKCIPLSQVCNGHDDCADKSDESMLKCHHSPHPLIKTCAKDEFTCKGGGCVSKLFVCDGKNDCYDGSDETNVTCRGKAHGCGSDEFQCVSDKRCISLLRVCDTFNDCADHSDEKRCNPLGGLNFGVKCQADNDFYCGLPGKCVSQSWRCDGEPDCPNGADERDCTSTTCLPPKLACNTGNKCIHPKQMCDGKKDCDDNSDEKNCPKVSKTQECNEKTHFRCPSSPKGSSSGQMCIPWNKVCDHKEHCLNGEDEAPGGKASNCQLNPCKHAGCTQNCQNRYTHAVCSCRPGYKLLSDNATCVDINECKVWGTCSQHCANTKGSYKCSCELGYQLYTGKHGKGRCRAIGDPSLILASQEYIRQYRLKENEERPIVSDLINVADLDYDAKVEPPVVFWSQPTPPALLMAKIQKSGKPDQIQIYSKDNSVPEGLAYDWVHKLVYMTDPGLKRIAVLNITSKTAAVIATGDIDEPRAIAVDPSEGWLYWTDWGHRAKISKMGMNGQFRSVLISENIVLPNALALDRPQRRLYWSDAKQHAIYSIDLNGHDRRLIYQDGSIYPYSMSVFEDRVYWSDWQSESVLSVEKFTGEEFTKIFTSHRISAVRVKHLLMQPNIKSRCTNHLCSHFCLPAPIVGEMRHGPGYTCGCPENLILQNDDRTCVTKGRAVSKPPRVIIGSGKGTSTTRKPVTDLGEQRRVGHVAGIVIGIVLLLTVVVGAMMLLLYRIYSRKNMRSMNFDNPVYRKPTLEEGDTEAQFPINSTLGLTTVNNNSVRAPIWNGGVVNGAVEA